MRDRQTKTDRYRKKERETLTFDIWGMNKHAILLLGLQPVTMDIYKTNT